MNHDEQMAIFARVASGQVSLRPTRKRQPLKIKVVADEYGACPRCGAYWGHPDKALDYPNRQKVDHYWKCYNPSCTAGYYDPERRKVVEDKPTPEEMAEIERRSKERIDAMMVGKHWETVQISPGITESRLVPDEEAK